MHDWWTDEWKQELRDSIETCGGIPFFCHQCNRELFTDGSGHSPHCEVKELLDEERHDAIYG